MLRAGCCNCFSLTCNLFHSMPHEFMLAFYAATPQHNTTQHHLTELVSIAHFSNASFEFLATKATKCWYFKAETSYPQHESYKSNKSNLSGISLDLIRSDFFDLSLPHIGLQFVSHFFLEYVPSINQDFNAIFFIFL